MIFITPDFVFIYIYPSVHYKHPFPVPKFIYKSFLSIRIRRLVSFSNNRYLNFKLLKIIMLSNKRDSYKKINLNSIQADWLEVLSWQQKLNVYILNRSFLYIFEQLSENCEQLISFSLPKKKSSLQKYEPLRDSLPL